MSAAEFVLEGLHAHKRIGRNEERVFTAGEKPQRNQERVYEREEPFRAQARTLINDVPVRFSVCRRRRSTSR